MYLIEDAAWALGANFGDRKAGSFGDLESFSLHPRKAIASREGGIVTTNNDELANKVRILKNHGIDNTKYKIDFVSAGFNYRLIDFQAALVLGQFYRLEEIITKRQKLADKYREEIQKKNVSLPIVPKNRNHTWQTFHILLEDEETRNSLINYLKEKGVQSNYEAQCIPHMTYYRNKYGYDSEKIFPNAYRAYTCGLAIPLYDSLSNNKVKYISNLINKFYYYATR